MSKQIRDAVKQGQANTVSVPNGMSTVGGVMNDSNKASAVTFPTAWTGRVQTPIRRVPASDLYGTPQAFQPNTYGGPQHG
jgi:hypothetical protein